MSLFYRVGPLYYESQYTSGRNESNVTDCTDGIQWMWKILGDCVVTTKEEVSAYCGLASILIWMMVNVPQIIKNCRNLDGLAGISFFLLFQWAGGDVTNLIGSILTHQLKPQIILACYFVISDVILLVQYSGYLIRKRRRNREETRGVPNETSRLILCLMGIFAFSLTVCGHVFSASSSSFAIDSSGNYHFNAGRQARSLLSYTAEGSVPQGSARYHIPRSDVAELESLNDRAEVSTKGKQGAKIFWHDEVNIIGYIIGVVSSLFYLGSRLAQIYKNVKTQSTEGLALLTFLLAVFGNVAYGAQILVLSVEAEFILEKLPWLVGSLGVVGLDCFLLFQFHYYKGKGRNRDEINKAMLTKDYIINGDSQSSVEVNGNTRHPIYQGI